MRRYDLQRVQRDVLFPRLKPIEMGPVESPIESLGIPDGTRLENLFGNGTRARNPAGCRGGGVGTPLSAIYLELPSQKPERN
jgi:hypothetical protein